LSGFVRAGVQYPETDTSWFVGKGIVVEI